METFAANLKNFIISNNINLDVTSMDEVVEGYMKAQDEMYERIKADVMATL